MKFKTNLSTLALSILALFTMHFLTSISQSEAMGYGSIGHRHCSSWNCRMNCRRRSRHADYDIFNALFSILRNDDHHERGMSRFFQSSGPEYKISEDDSKMELMVDVPGFRASDINIHIDEKKGRRVTLAVSGTKNSNSRYPHPRQGRKDKNTTFQQKFTIDPKTVDIKKVKASMADGVLVISVPKIEKQVKEKRYVIPIDTQGDGSNRDETLLITHEKNKEDVKKEEDSNGLEITEEDI